MKTVITLVIDHEKPIVALPDLVAGRAWTIDGVKSAEIQTPVRVRTADKAPPDPIAIQPDEIAPRWLDVI